METRDSGDLRKTGVRERERERLSFSFFHPPLFGLVVVVWIDINFIVIQFYNKIYIINYIVLLKN